MAAWSPASACVACTAASWPPIRRWPAALLTGVLSARSIDVDRQVVAEIGELCGHLPLALQIAAANLVIRPAAGHASYVDELRRGDRLAALSLGDGHVTAVTAAFSLSGLPVVHGTPMRDPAGSAPKALADTGTVELIQLVVRRHAERVDGEARHRHGFVSDGSLLHEWVYATVRLELGPHPPAEARLRRADSAPYADVIATLGAEITRRAVAAYDLVVHLPVEFPLTDPVKPVSERFRALSDELLLRTFAEAGVTVHPVTGSVPARLSRIVGLCAEPAVR